MFLRILLCNLCLLLIAFPAMAQEEMPQDNVPDVPRLAVPVEDATPEDKDSIVLIQETEDLQNEQETAAEPPPVPQPTDTNTIGNRIFDALPAAIQQEILAEAEYVFERCEANDFYARFYDCRCLAVKFTDARVEQGPEKKPLVLAEEQEDQCVNQPGIAGHAWEQCQNIASNMKIGRDEFCECFANSYVKEYMKYPDATTPRMKTAMSHALGSCDNGNGPIKGKW